MRAHDLGSLYPSDLADVAPKDPVASLQEYDYHITNMEASQAAPTIVEKVRNVIFNYNDTIVGTIQDDTRDGYATINGLRNDGVQVSGVRIFIGVNSPWRKGHVVTCIRNRMSSNCEWIAVVGSYYEPMYAPPTDAELGTAEQQDNPPLDPYYQTLA